MIQTLQAPAKQEIPWFKSWFDTNHYHALYGGHDEQEAQTFIDALIRKLRPASGASALDIGCGNGRHSKWLTSSGFNVTGFDLSANSIRKAKKLESDRLRFVQHDMRCPFGKNRYDYIFNFFTSFGYFESEDENFKVVRNMSDALKVNGTLLIDYLNVPCVEKHLVPGEKKEINGISYHITRWMSDSHFYKKIIIDDPVCKELLEFREQVSKFSLEQFEYMLALHNLEIISIYGDYHLSTYDSETSPRLILLARKTE